MSRKTFPWQNPILPHGYRVPTLETATEYLGDKSDRPLANNTRLVRDGDGANVVLHRTAVVRIPSYEGRADLPSDARYTLHTGGWRTMTTKSRINAFSPAGISVIRGDWFLTWDSNVPVGMYPTSGFVGYAWCRVPFREGMAVDGRGRPVEREDLALLQMQTMTPTTRGTRSVHRCVWTPVAVPTFG